MTLKTNIPTLAWQKQKDDKIIKPRNASLKIERSARSKSSKSPKRIHMQSSDEIMDEEDLEEYPDQVKLINQKTPQFTITAEPLGNLTQNSPYPTKFD